MSTSVRHSPIDGVIELLAKPFNDHRGAFLNAFRLDELLFMQLWGDRSIRQVNISRTNEVGSVRGLHLQSPPYGEMKIVRCLSGCVWDVAVDLRPASATFGKWHAVELAPSMANALVIPEGCAHGYQVLEPHSELLYLHSREWVPEAETGIRYDDPQLAIAWPLKPNALSDRDLALPLLESGS